MKVVENNYIPFKGFTAINLFGVIFIRKEVWDKLSRYRQRTTLRHERIHTAQMKELWYIGFYIAYFAEWLYRLVFHTKTAYEGISFEREAYRYQYSSQYLDNRIPFAQWKK